MKIGENFVRENLTFTYLDPFHNFEKKETHLEVRKDPITETISRVLPYRFRIYERPSVEDYLKKSPPEKCPFCLPQRDLLTPRFPVEINPEGQFRKGEAVCFPNAFPHSHYNTVVVLGNTHYLGLEEMKAGLLMDGLQVCLDYMRRMFQINPNLQYASINWNYMPPAGGGLLHPHLQTVMGEGPTVFMGKLLSKSREYRMTTGRDLWVDYLAWEKEKKERYVGRGEGAEWLTAFAPRGMAGEVVCILPEKLSLTSLADADLASLSKDLLRIFKYLNSINLVSFNLALFGTMVEEPLFPVQGRIIPRYLIRPLDTSDVNYFEKLHGEVICPFVPEDMAEGLKTFFHDL